MKKIIFAFAILCAAMLQAQPAIPLPTRSIEKTSPNSGTPLNNASRYYYFRDTAGVLQQFQTDRWDNGEFSLYSTEFYSYDNEGNLEQVTSRRWNSTVGYTDNYRYSYTYDQAGNRLSRTREVYSASAGVWATTSVILYSYSATNQLLERKTTSFSNGQQTQANRTTYLYDTDGRNTDMVIQDFIDTAWVNKSKTSFMYNDPDSRPEIQHEFQWFSATSAWNLGHRYTMTYTGNMDNKLLEYQNSGDWDTLGRYLIEYAPNNKILYSNYELYSASDHSFVLTSSVSYEYNPDQSIHVSKSYRTDPSTQVYFQNYQEDFDYGQYSGTQDVGLNIQINILPNPTSDFLQVRVEGDIFERPTFLRLYSASGNLVEQARVNGAIMHLDISGQAAGAYFLEITQGNSRKVVTVMKSGQ